MSKYRFCSVICAVLLVESIICPNTGQDRKNQAKNIQVIGLLEARRYGMKTRSERASERKLEQCCMQEKLRGEKCEFTRQCKDGLCCLKKGSYGPTCQPIAQLREKCTTRAVDGVYKIRCPCADHARCHVRIHICVSARKVLNSTIGASKS
nr:uncharacterized protein LOC126534137 isoform X3 [Dermacentor andersoni]